MDRGRGGGGVAGLADNFLTTRMLRMFDKIAPSHAETITFPLQNFPSVPDSTGSISAAFGGWLRELCVTAFFMKFALELKLLLTFRHISLRKIMMVGNDFWKAANKFKRRNRNRRFGNLIFKFNDLCCYDSNIQRFQRIFVLSRAPCYSTLWIKFTKIKTNLTKLRTESETFKFIMSPLLRSNYLNIS